jgi:hypothetical protein
MTGKRREGDGGRTREERHGSRKAEACEPRSRPSKRQADREHRGDDRGSACDAEIRERHRSLAVDIQAALHPGEKKRGEQPGDENEQQESGRRPVMGELPAPLDARRDQDDDHGCETDVRTVGKVEAAADSFLMGFSVRLDSDGDPEIAREQRTPPKRQPARQAWTSPGGSCDRREEQGEERRSPADLSRQPVDRRPVGKEVEQPADSATLVPEVLPARPGRLPRQIEAREEREPADGQKERGPGLGAEATPNQAP